jgi:hypothetical protein
VKPKNHSIKCKTRYNNINERSPNQILITKKNNESYNMTPVVNSSSIPVQISKNQNLTENHFKIKKNKKL